MNLFTKNKISSYHEEAADKLKQARLGKNIKLETAAKNLNINIKYLAALENGQPNKLPNGIYGKNYLREYARWLGLDAAEIISLYGLDNNISTADNDFFIQKVRGVKHFLSLPKIITNLVIMILVIVCISYLGYRLKNIIAPPNLTITNPVSDITIKENFIDIQGLTEPEAEVTINGELVLINQTGYFTKKVNLKSGVNIITITAQKKYSRKNYIEKKILVNN